MERIRLGRVCFLLNADKLIHRIALGAFKILQMHNRAASGILADIGNRIFSANLHPARVQLGLQMVCRNGRIHIVETIHAVFHLHKFKIVVVINQNHTKAFTNRTDAIDFGKHLVKILVAGTFAFAEIRNGNAFAADRFVSGNHLFGVHLHFSKRNVCTNGFQTGFVEFSLKIGIRIAEKACRLNIIIAHRLHGSQGFRNALCHFITNGVKL